MVVVSTIGGCLCLTKPASHVLRIQAKTPTRSHHDEENRTVKTRNVLRIPRTQSGSSAHATTRYAFDSGPWLVIWGTRIRHVRVQRTTILTGIRQ